VKRDLRVVCDEGTAANKGNPSKGMNRVTWNASGIPVGFRAGRNLTSINVTNLKAGSGAQ